MCGAIDPVRVSAAHAVLNGGGMKRLAERLYKVASLAAYGSGPRKVERMARCLGSDSADVDGFDGH